MRDGSEQKDNYAKQSKQFQTRKEKQANDEEGKVVAAVVVVVKKKRSGEGDQQRALEVMRTTQMQQRN